jgi:hypothetical protein
MTRAIASSFENGTDNLSGERGSVNAAPAATGYFIAACSDSATCRISHPATT